jgi:tetrahydromethanopterin S-methyltransferase subunit A
MRFVKGMMRLLGRVTPTGARGERPSLVQMFHRADVLRDLATGGPFRRTLRRAWRGHAWPVTSGAYLVSDPQAPLAVCTLTSSELMQPLAELAGVSIAGRVYTPNLGIEKIVLNVTTNSAIRFLVLCGRESPVFQPAQAIRALVRDGITPDRRIIGAEGHFPVLRNLTSERIEAFRRQVELVDLTGETSVTVLATRIRALAESAHGVDPGRQSPGAVSLSAADSDDTSSAFAPIRPGGRREPLAYDPKGFFVVTVDHGPREITCRHFWPDHSPGHEMRGHSAEGMLLGLIREGLVSELTHAGYLGAELAKAETALRLGLHYEQDRPLRTEATTQTRGGGTR